MLFCNKIHKVLIVIIIEYHRPALTPTLFSVVSNMATFTALTAVGMLFDLENHRVSAYSATDDSTDSSNRPTSCERHSISEKLDIQ